MELSSRLSAVAQMVTPGNIVCDVGCDHGYIPIYLIQNNISPYVFAMDVNAGPLQRAKEHITEFGFTDRIETILSDGLSAFGNKKSDALVCAGMGGRLMVKILSEGKDKIDKMQEMILQPQSEIQQVRAFLRNQGYYIDGENMVYEDGKFYPVMHVLVHSDKQNEENPLWDKFGPKLLKNQHPVLWEYLVYTMKQLEKIEVQLSSHGRADTIETKMKELRCRQLEVEDAMRYFQTF